MNKELEETVNKIKEYYEDGEFSLKVLKPLDIILNYIENSISTKRIKSKKQKLEKEYKEAMQINPTKAFIIKCQLEFVEEILEGK